MPSRNNCARERKQARDADETRYEGVACTQCNGTSRYVSSGACITCAIEGRRIGAAIASNKRSLAKLERMQLEAEARMHELSLLAYARKLEGEALQARRIEARTVRAKLYDVSDL